MQITRTILTRIVTPLDLDKSKRGMTIGQQIDALIQETAERGQTLQSIQFDVDPDDWMQLIHRDGPRAQFKRLDELNPYGDSFAAEATS